MEKIDPKNKLLQQIEEAEKEYKEYDKKCKEYEDKCDKAEKTLYDLSYEYMKNYVSYRNKYIKVDDECRTVYLYVNYQMLTPYISENTDRRLYEYVLKGKGCSKDNINGHYIISDDIKIFITGKEGEFAPHNNSDVEIITKEEYEKVVNEYINNVTNIIYQTRKSIL